MLYTCEQHKLLAENVVQQRRQLPPAVNDKALFTKASPFGDPKDPFYHSPCNRIASYFAPHAAASAGLHLEDDNERQGLPRHPGKLGNPAKSGNRLSFHHACGNKVSAAEVRVHYFLCPHSDTKHLFRVDV